MRLRSKPLIVSLTLVFALSFPTFAADSVGKITGGGNSIMWSGQGNWESVSLTVLAPDGSSYQRTFKNGNPSFSLRDLTLVEDGQYNFELSVEPKISPAVRAALNTARARGDQAEVARLQKEHGLSQRTTQSGTFTILNGQIVNPEGTEADANDSAAAGSVGTNATSATGEPRAARPGKIGVEDQVIPDDLIVQSSTCTGFDCVDGESFGFDTLRLKENNLRIHFDDTSSSAGYPNNDWRIIANDSASGGANKFVVEDSTAARNPFTIEAASPANSLYVDSTGNIGFQQSTPLLDLHVTTTDTPALRMEQTNGGGFTAQTWDIGANEANFFVRDLTGGSKLSFRIRPGAPTSSIDIAADGKVGVGTASPQAALDVRGTNAHVLVGSATSDFIGPAQTAYGASNGTERLFFGVQTGLAFLGSASNTGLGFVTNNSTKVTIDTAGNVGIGTGSPSAQLMLVNGASSSSINAGSAQFTIASSRDFKDNIEPVSVDGILDRIEAVPVVTYDYKNDGPKDRLGLVAEDFHKVFERGDDKHIDGHEVQMALWLAVQELSAKNKELAERVQALQQKLEAQAEPIN